MCGNVAASILYPFGHATGIITVRRMRPEDLVVCKGIVSVGKIDTITHGAGNQVPHYGTGRSVDG